MQVSAFEGWGHASFALLAAALALTFFFFAPTARGLIHEWGLPEYSHCPLIFLIALGWAFSIARTKHPVASPSAFGILICSLGLAMNLFGALAANNWFAQYALIIAVCGMVIALGGWAVFRTLFPALFFLSFAIPLPPILLASLTASMQLVSSTASVMGLRLLNIPVFQEGNIIDLGTYKLQVAEACSGLRYLFPFLSFGYLFAMLFETIWWKRIVVILFTVPVTILLNALRIMIVGVTVDHWGIKMAKGVLHDFEGWVVFVGCIACLLLLHAGLSLIHTPAPPPRTTSVPASGAMPSPAQPMLIFLIAILSFGVVGQSLMRPAQQDANVPRQTFALFPLQIAQWSGHTQDLPSDQAQTLKVSDYFLSDYSTPHSPAAVNLYIAYYASQRRDAAPHSPLVCISGSGWEITKLSSDFSVRDAQGQVLAHVNRALIKNGTASELVYFWFSERGRNLTTSTQRKWFLIKDALTKKRTDGALIRVATPISPSEQEINADQRLAAFLRDTVPLFHSYIPD